MERYILAHALITHSHTLSHSLTLSHKAHRAAHKYNVRTMQDGFGDGEEKGEEDTDCGVPEEGEEEKKEEMPSVK